MEAADVPWWMGAFNWLGGGSGGSVTGINSAPSGIPNVNSYANRIFGGSGAEVKYVTQTTMGALSLTQLAVGPEDGLGEGVIARVAISPEYKFGTTLFGQAAHEGAEPIVKAMLEKSEATDIVTRVQPGEKSVDISYKLGDALGHIEIKPNTASGMRSFTQQVAQWAKKGIDPNAVKAMTYDAQGNLRWGFHF